MCAKSLAHRKIVSEIQANGPMTFARFMELALYDHEGGYYASGRARIGKQGDFFTNVSVGPVFGQILAIQFQEMWSRLGKPARFALVEQGANDGQLALDILGAMASEILETVEYWIIEPFPALRRLQEEKLQNAEAKVKWVDDLDALPVFDGIHLSNELVDSFPFHLIHSNGNGWEELCVSTDEGRLAFEVACPSTLVADALKALPPRPAGTIAELRPAACGWIHALAGRLNRGFVLIVDYGFPRFELLAPHRTNGTFCCYRGHRRDSRPLEDPGEKDISAHVDFTAVAEAALAAGFRIEGFADQHHYLVGASRELLAKVSNPPNELSQKSLRALQTLLHPESMGTQFRYLALSKGVALAPPLSGFEFARDAQQQLFAEVP
jgi:SAM-dependent MidA family methyltransferase